METFLAFVAVMVSTVFAQRMTIRYVSKRRPAERAFAIGLWLFAFAAVCLALGFGTGWDEGIFRFFFLLGVGVNVPWLALGTIHLQFGRRVGRGFESAVLLYSGLAAGAILVAPLDGTIAGSAIPEAKDHMHGFAYAIGAVGSSVGATIIFIGAAVSAFRFRRVGNGKNRAVGNGVIAFGTLVLSGGGTMQGLIGKDASFAASLAVGIALIFAGFLISTKSSRVIDLRESPLAADVEVAV